MREVVHFLYTDQIVNASGDNGGRPVSWLAQRPYKPPEGPACAGGIETPALRYFFVRFRFAARKRVSRHQVIGLASSPSAASQIVCFSAAVKGILMSSSRRSSGAFGGRPIFMPTNHIHKNLKNQADSPLKGDSNCGYNNCVDNETRQPRKRLPGGLQPDVSA
jgi:hypothetical protein